MKRTRVIEAADPRVEPSKARRSMSVGAWWSAAPRVASTSMTSRPVLLHVRQYGQRQTAGPQDIHRSRRQHGGTRNSKRGACKFKQTALKLTINKKAQLSLTNPRDAKACKSCSNSIYCLQRCRWQYSFIYLLNKTIVKSAVKWTIEQDSKDKALTAAQKLKLHKNYKTIYQTEIKIQNNICNHTNSRYSEKSIVLMQRLNLGRDEKSVWWDDKPFQISTTRSEKNEDLVELGQWCLKIL